MTSSSEKIGRGNAGTTLDRLASIDLSPWRRGNAGVDYATTFAADVPGPHALIMALMHGNELCGAHAIAYLHEQAVRPARGRLTLAFANIAAYETSEDNRPSPSRFVKEDMNRLWSAEILDGPSDSPELRRARELRPLIDSADYLLDLHAMENTGPPLTLAGLTRRATNLARRMGYPEHIVRDRGHANGTRLRDYGAFASDTSDRTALLVECGQRDDPASADAAIHVSLGFLAALDLIPPELCAKHAQSTARIQPRVIDVTHAIAVDHGPVAFLPGIDGGQVVAQAGTIIAYDGTEAVRTPYDDCVLVMPSREATRGQTAIRFGRFAEP